MTDEQLKELEEELRHSGGELIITNSKEPKLHIHLFYVDGYGLVIKSKWKTAKRDSLIAQWCSGNSKDYRDNREDDKKRILADIENLLSDANGKIERKD